MLCGHWLAANLVMLCDGETGGRSLRASKIKSVHSSDRIKTQEEAEMTRMKEGLITQATRCDLCPSGKGLKENVAHRKSGRGDT